MRLKRSVLSPCPNCNTTKYLDVRINRGGYRYVDLCSIQCEICCNPGPYEMSKDKAMASWNATNPPRPKLRARKGEK